MGHSGSDWNLKTLLKYSFGILWIVVIILRSKAAVGIIDFTRSTSAYSSTAAPDSFYFKGEYTDVSRSTYDESCLQQDALLRTGDTSSPFVGERLNSYVECSARHFKSLVLSSSAPTAAHYLRSPKCMYHRTHGFTTNETKTLGTGRRIRCYKNYTDSEFRREHGGGLIISETHKLIYIPNMKVASQMFKDVLEARFNAVKINQHELQKVLDKNNHSFSEYLVFTFVRDPLTHFISAYAELDKQKTKKAKRMNHTWGFLTIPRNISSEPARSIRLINDVRNGTFWGFSASHMYSQFWKISRCLSTQYFPLLPKFIGKIETVDKDWKQIENYLQVPHIPLKPKHYYSHPAKKHAKQIPLASSSENSKFTRLIKEICRFYRVDYDCFDYPLPAIC